MSNHQKESTKIKFHHLNFYPFQDGNSFLTRMKTKKKNSEIISERIYFNDLPMISSKIYPNSNLSYNDKKNKVNEWKGVGRPRSELHPEEIPTLLMIGLTNNHYPIIDAGLISMWHFAGDTTRHIFQNNMTEFIESAHETANTLPTSFYGSAMYGLEWMMESGLNQIGGEKGWIATQVMKTVCSDGRIRRWQWELRKHKRPPNLNCWYVESIGSSDRKGNFEPE